jgi:hypothetical protein
MALGTVARPVRPVLVPIPGGLWGNGRKPRRELSLRAVGAEDEAFLLEAADRLGPSQRASALLARCVVPDETNGVDGSSLVARLTVGDREAALLHLRRLSVGDRVDCIVACPAAGCGEAMEIEIAIGDLLVPPIERPRREYRMQVELDGTPTEVRFRLPTTADLEAVAEAARVDPEDGATVLLGRCVRSISRGGRAVPVESLDEPARDAIAGAMAERDPQAEIELELSCPSCGHGFSVLLDAGTYLLQELDARAARLLEDVHALALHYHWSEPEILALSPARRERYLELLTASLQASTGAPGYPSP